MSPHGRVGMRTTQAKTVDILFDTVKQIRKPEANQPFKAQNRKEALHRIKQKHIDARHIRRDVHIDNLQMYSRTAVQPWSIQNYNEGLLELLGDLVYIVVIIHNKRPKLLYTLEGRHFTFYDLDSARNQVRTLRDSPLLAIDENDSEMEKSRKEKTMEQLQKAFVIYNRLKFDDRDIAQAEKHLRAIEKNLAYSLIE